MVKVSLPVSLDFDFGNFETPWNSCLEDARWVVLDRHLLHLFNVVLAISTQRVLGNIAVIEITEILNSKAIVNTC